MRGSGHGGVGTSCRISWRVALVLANDPGGDILELVLPSNSCFGKEEKGKWPFKPYIQMLADNNVSAGRIVTKMQFDVNSQKPRALFSPVDAVEDYDIETVKTQGDNQAAHNAIKLTVYQPDITSEKEAVKFESFDATKENKVTPKSKEESQEAQKIVDKWRLCIKANLAVKYVAEGLDVSRMTLHTWFRGGDIRQRNILKVKKFINIIEEGLADGVLPADNLASAKVFVESEVRPVL